MSASHKNQISRINRINGQIDAIKRMINDDRHCVEIMTQIRAARNALKSVELEVLEMHMKSCLNDACKVDAQDREVDEIIKLLKKYE